MTTDLILLTLKSPTGIDDLSTIELFQCLPQAFTLQMKSYHHEIINIQKSLYHMFERNMMFLLSLPDAFVFVELAYEGQSCTKSYHHTAEIFRVQFNNNMNRDRMSLTSLLHALTSVDLAHKGTVALSHIR